MSSLARLTRGWITFFNVIIFYAFIIKSLNKTYRFHSAAIS